jgi:hypothetical protein
VAARGGDAEGHAVLPVSGQHAPARHRTADHPGVEPGGLARPDRAGLRAGLEDQVVAALVVVGKGDHEPVAGRNDELRWLEPHVVDSYGDVRGVPGGDNRCRRGGGVPGGAGDALGAP